VELARRLVEEAGVAGLTLHPRAASQRHQGAPDYAQVRELVAELPVPVLVSGGLHRAEQVRAAWEQTGAEAVMLARGSLGNPWLFAELLGRRETPPSHDEVLDELDWVLERAVEHLGEERAGRYLRKFYPWYLERLGAERAVQDALQRTPSVAEASAMLAGLRLPAAA
jgi:tRNA-dihydrouridine synthase